VKIFCCKFNVLFNASFSFHLVDQFFEVFFTYFHNYVRVHLNKSSVAVPSPTWVAWFFSKYIDNVFVKTKVQDCIHHTRHRCSCTRTNGNKKWILFITEFLSCDSFHLCNSFHDLSHDFFIDLSSVLIILSTSFCCDCEALWHWKT